MEDLPTSLSSGFLGVGKDCLAWAWSSLQQSIGETQAYILLMHQGPYSFPDSPDMPPELSVLFRQVRI